MERGEKKYGIIILVIVLLGYVLPYTILKNIDAWYGSFLLWFILAIAIIIINFIYTRNWGE